MKSNKPFLFITLLASVFVSSCYHEGSGSGGGGGNNGNTFLNVSITATPSSTFSFPTLEWPIGQIQLVNAAGTAVPLATSVGVAFPDLTRLQTDSLYLGHVTIAATSYTKLQVQFNAPVFGYFYNSSGSTLLGCAAGTVCLIPTTVHGFGSATVTVPVTFTATPNTNTGIRINFDLSKAVTNASGMTFDFSQTGAITLTTLPPSATSQTTGLDTVDNFTGAVTAVSGSTVTIGSFASEQRTFTVASSAVFNDPFNVCGGTATFACLAVNQNVSVDGVVNSDGSFTANEVEILDPAPLTSELEGVIMTPVNSGVFKMALTNGMGTASLIVGTTVTVNLNSSATFAVDPKNLGVTTSPLGFQSASDLVMGQTVMLKGGTINGTNTSLSNETRVLLRYSSVGGTISAPASPIFNLTNISPFLTNLLSNSAEVETFNTTAYDNVASFGGLTGGTNASIRALYLNPNAGVTQPFLAAKVRTH